MRLAKKLKSNYKIVFIAPESEYSEKIRKKGFDFKAIQLDAKSRNLFKEIKSCINIYRTYSKLNLDVLLHYTIKPNIYGTIAANMLGIKTVNNIAGLGSNFTETSLFRKMLEKLYKYSQKDADFIFFQNNEDKNLFINNNIITHDRFKRIPGSGVNLERFDNNNFDRNKNDDLFRFLLVGRLLWDKGVGEYVRAAKKMNKKYSKVKFEILGFLDSDNPNAITSSQMEKWEDEGDIEYLGVSDNVEKVMIDSDCVVLPSYYREGVPRTLLEASALSKPIITTDNVGCREVIQDGKNGFMCKKRDVDSLFKAMEKIYNKSKGELEKMGKAGRKMVENKFDEMIIINEYIDIIKNLLNK